MSRWKNIFTKRSSDLDEEIQFHIAMATRDRIERGESPETARIAAMREFGNLPLVKDVVHEMWGRVWLDRLARDLHYALRQLRRSPGFTVTVVLTLALAIGANTAIFSLAYALLLRSLPIPHPDQIVQLEVHTLGPEPNPYLTSAFYGAVKDRQRVFSGLCAWRGYWFTGEQNGDGRGIGATMVSGDCFRTLGLHAFAGRLLTPEDDRPGTQTAVISYAWWQKRFQRDPGVIGKRVVMLDPFSKPNPVTIVGVLPPSFQSVQVGDSPAFFIPLGEKRDNFNQNVLIFARLNDGVDARQAEEQLAPGFRSWSASVPAVEKPEWLDSKNTTRLEVVPSRAGYSGIGIQYKKPLMLLQILVATLLLASCAYLGTLLSARSISRRREIALRAALGASRSRLIRQLFTESLMLAFWGGSIGVFFAWVASRFLLTFVQSGSEAATISVGPGRDVLLFALLITTVAVVLWGLIPALRASRVAVLSDMKNSTGGSFISGMPQRRVGRWLVPLQVALSLLIVVVAGLLSTSLVRLLSQDNGYRLRGTVFASTDFPFAFGKEASAKIAAELELQQTVLDRLTRAPGIQSASIGMVHVLSGSSYLDLFRTTPSGDENDYKSQTIMNIIGPRYFEIMGTHLLRGRGFSDSDTAASQPVCILTRATERHFFPQSDAVGRTLYQPQDKDRAKALRVVGVVDDMRYGDLRTDAPPIVYLDFTQMGEARNLEFVMKTDDPAEAVISLRDILHSVAPGVHVTKSITMEEQVGQSLARERLLATLSNFFAGLGLLLGAVSLYGVLNYSVHCRTVEIGVRMALGASRGTVVRMIIGEAARLVVPGLLIGGIVCVGATRLLRSLLYETKPMDPMIVTLSLVAIVAIAFVASWIPAHNASRIDPMQALRAE
jgi:predicted permease